MCMRETHLGMLEDGEGREDKTKHCTFADLLVLLSRIGFPIQLKSKKVRSAKKIRKVSERLS